METARGDRLRPAFNAATGSPASLAVTPDDA